MSRVKGITFFQLVPDRLVYAYAFGASTQYNFTKRFSIQSGLIYQRIGSDDIVLTFWDESRNSEASAVTSVNLSFITLPVLCKLSFGKKTRFFIGSGAYAAYLSSVSNKFKSDIFGFEPRGDSLYRHFDFGLILNTGLSIPITRKLSISTEARYSKGITPIGNSSAFYYYPVRTSSLAFLLGLVYNPGSRKS